MLDYIEESDNEDFPISRQQFMSHLCEKNNFVQTSPCTLTFQDERDVITVFATDSILIVTASGEEVIPSWNIIQVISNSDTFFWENALQVVLHKF